MNFLTYTDANGISHASYSDACVYYGADTPEQLALEAEYEHEEWLDHCCEHGLFITVIYDEAELPF